MYDLRAEEDSPLRGDPIFTKVYHFTILISQLCLQYYNITLVGLDAFVYNLPGSYCIQYLDNTNFESFTFECMHLVGGGGWSYID